MDSDAPLLELIDLAVQAGGRRLLSGINLTLPADSLVAVTGPSGCGKTAMLRAIAGLDDPADGRVRFRGQLPTELTLPCYRRQVVFVHQRPVMLDLSVRENLSRPFSIRAVGRSFDRERARELLEETGLTAAHLDQSARTLSIGEQQRVSLVRALLIEPAVLLLDEPTSALDEASRTGIESLLARLISGNGGGAIVITHDVQQAARMTDHVLDVRPHIERAAPAKDQRDE